MPRPDSNETAWVGGRLDGRAGAARLLFGRMYEDWAIEERVIAPTSRVFSIASAGCTALVLARAGHAVTAVDVNPEQIAYVRARMDGAPPREGVIERLLSFGRRILPWLGLSQEDRESFLAFEDPNDQLRFWRDRLAGGRFRAALRMALYRPLLRTIYGRAFLSALPRGRFDRIVCRRLERGFGLHPNARNPYAWQMLLGRDPPGLPQPEVVVGGLSLVLADAATYLETCEEQSFDAFTVSNILDGASPAFAARLQAAVRRAAAPGAIVILRSFAEPGDAESEHWAAADRSLLWGSVMVTSAERAGFCR